METRSIKIWTLAMLAMVVSGFGNPARAADASPTPTPLTANLAKAATTAVDATKTVAQDAKKSVHRSFKSIINYPLTTTKNSKGDEIPFTLGQAITAFLFIIFGYLVARFIGTKIERISVKRFKMQVTSASIIRKCCVALLFTIIAVQVLSAYNISLTVFAFLGGALAVGFGFGAQNIMSNFISGIILIFERPMRIGDSIEINDAGGTVRRIGLRASLVQRGDGVDMLIPNRNFLENVLVNQTYSNHLMRYSINIGVAYGTPIENAKSLLLKVIDGHASILKKPAPQVVVSAFGQYAIVFTLNYWIELGTGIDTGSVASDLRTKIDSVFTEHEIELKCPW